MALPTEPTYTAFFYGTLMAPPVLYRVIYGTSQPSPSLQSRTTFTPALLAGYRRHRVVGCDYPAMYPCPGSNVRGNLVAGLTARDLSRLDIFEGSQYARREVTVETLPGVELEESTAEATSGSMPRTKEEMTVQTYVWRDKYRADLEDGEWDFEVFKKEKMKAWMGESDGMNDVDQMEADAEVDEGFADVDRAVAEEATNATKKCTDPMGGRGINGAIGRQLSQTKT